MTEEMKILAVRYKGAKINSTSRRYTSTLRRLNLADKPPGKYAAEDGQEVVIEDVTLETFKRQAKAWADREFLEVSPYTTLDIIGFLISSSSLPAGLLADLQDLEKKKKAIDTAKDIDQLRKLGG